MTRFTGLLVLMWPLLVGAAEQGLLGKWQCQSDEGAVSLEFQSRDRLLYDGEPSRYTLQPGVILVDEEFGPVAYRYRLQNNQLAVVFPEGASLQCQRVASKGSKRAAAATGAGGGMAANLLQGRLCNWGGASNSASGYYRLSSMVFDGNGGVVYSNEASFGSEAGGYYGSGGGVPGRYRIEGNVVHIRLDDGSSTAAQVNMRQNDGRITELMSKGQLWADALCQ